MRPAAVLLLVVVGAAVASSLLPLAASDFADVSSICSRTPIPTLCLAISRRYTHILSDTVDVHAVLSLQVRAAVRRTKSAKVRAARLAASGPIAANPAAVQALNFCENMYSNTLDTLGAVTRAADFHDKAVAKIMLTLALQNYASCDFEFKKISLANPMARFDTSLTKMANNCIAVNDLM